jgi:hypothetical protein
MVSWQVWAVAVAENIRDASIIKTLAGFIIIEYNTWDFLFYENEKNISLTGRPCIILVY